MLPNPDLLKKPLTENFIFCAAYATVTKIAPQKVLFSSLYKITQENQTLPQNTDSIDSIFILMSDTFLCCLEIKFDR